MKEKKRKPTITPTVKEIIEGLSCGLSDTEIAEELNLTLCALRSRISRILNDTRCANRPHLVSWAYKNHILGEGHNAGTNNKRTTGKLQAGSKRV